MWVRDSYDIPAEVAAGPHSPAFEKFLWNWFGNTYELTHGELDISFLQELSPEDLALARAMMRRNLRLRKTHIIKGAAALRDIEAVPILREMVDAQVDHDWRLTIAGALWNLVRDPVFVTCLYQAKKAGGTTIGAHLYKVLWLDDERALDFLIDLLDQRERVVWTFTLGLLSELEFGRRFAIAAEKQPRQPNDYRARRADPAFREALTAAIRRFNRRQKGGAFGWLPVE